MEILIIYIVGYISSMILIRLFQVSGTYDTNIDSLEEALNISLSSWIIVIYYLIGYTLKKYKIGTKLM